MTLNRILNISTDNGDSTAPPLYLLIFVMPLAGIIGVVADLIRDLPLDLAPGEADLYRVAAIVLFIGIAFGARTFHQRNRPVQAGHFLLIAVDLCLLALLILTDSVAISTYLLLAAVFVTAIWENERIAAGYAGATFLAIALYYLFNGNQLAEALQYGLTVAVVFLIGRLANGRLLHSRQQQAKQLAENNELTGQITLLDRRIEQLRLTAEVGRVASSSLDIDQVLEETVRLVTGEFGFDYATILLVDENAENLVVYEASGHVGQRLKDEGYSLPIGPESIVGWVAAERKARITMNVAEDPLFHDVPELPDTQSELALPLIARDQLLGVLDVQSHVPNAFQDEDIVVLQIMADEIAGSIDNARLFTQSESQAELLTQLQLTTRLMNEQVNSMNTLNVLTQQAMSLLGTDGGGVWLWRENEGLLELVLSFNVGEDLTGRKMAPGEGLSGQAFSNNETLIVDDYQKWLDQSDAMADSTFHSAMAVPLRSQNRPIGVLALTHSQIDRPFKNEEAQVIELLTSQAGTVIVNNRLVEETRRLARREQTINEIAGEIRRSLDAKTILETTARELGQALGEKTVRVRLFDQDEQPAERES